MFATIPDPKKASKYWKRVEGLWKEGKPASDVVPFLKRYNLQGSLPGKTVRKRVRPTEDVVDADVEKSRKTAPVRQLDAASVRNTVIKSEQEIPSPKGIFAVVHRVPANDWDEIGARVQFGGTVHSIDGDELTIAVALVRPATRSKV